MKSLPLHPTPATPQVGRRLRARREQARISLADLAQATGLSKGFLSRVERDLTSPSVASLVALCQALGTTPGQVLDAPEVTVVRHGEAPAVSLGGDGIAETLLTPPGLRALQVLRADIAPGGTGEEELYTVDCEVESVHVVSGRLVLRTPERSEELGAGDTATFSGQEPHSWQNPDPEAPATVLWILAGRT